MKDKLAKLVANQTSGGEKFKKKLRGGKRKEACRLVPGVLG